MTMHALFNNYSIIIIVLLVGCNTNSNSEIETEESTSIAFGSCSKQWLPEQLWSEIAEENADMFVLLGDNIYADTQDMQALSAMYQEAGEDPDFKKLVSSTYTVGVWDDHDYGVNDGGKYFSKKDSSKRLMLDFLKVPADHEVRSRKGVYQSYQIGNDDNLVKLILLDTRYFRDTLMPDTRSENRYLINHDGDILGEAQWNWLAHELNQSKAKVNIIGSSIEVLAKDHPYEKWANFPKARVRLINLIDSLSSGNTIIISGDRHVAEISKLTLPKSGDILYDFTASGLTHTWENAENEINELRDGPLIIERNYGMVRINWTHPAPQIIFDVKGHNDTTFHSHSFFLNE